MQGLQGWQIQVAGRCQRMFLLELPHFVRKLTLATDAVSDRHVVTKFVESSLGIANGPRRMSRSGRCSRFFQYRDYLHFGRINEIEHSMPGTITRISIGVG